MLLRRAATAFGLVACAHAPCPGETTCGEVRWSQATVGDEREVNARAVALAVPGLRADLGATDALPVSPQRAFLQFEAPAVAGRAVVRAVLALSPHPRWIPAAGATRLVARDLRSTWSARAVAEGDPPTVGAATVAVPLPAGVRGPVRLDLTALLASGVGAAGAWGIALETDRGEAVFMGGAAVDRSARPHLEIVLR